MGKYEYKEDYDLPNQLQDLAARLVKYKISLTVADLIILFIYAPTQLAWISTYWVSKLDHSNL